MSRPRVRMIQPGASVAARTVRVDADEPAATMSDESATLPRNRRRLTRCAEEALSLPARAFARNMARYSTSPPRPVRLGTLLRRTAC